jgi:Transposase DDE domain group 1
VLSRESGQPVRIFKDLPYQTRESWSCARRVVGKAEHLPDKPNPRFVVTSYPVERMAAAALYEQLYCARGDMENRIKEQQLGLFADRTSSATMRANQLRLWFAALAYALLNHLRHRGLCDTELARAQVSTIRARLLKIGARVTISVRRIVASLSSAFPLQELFTRVLAHLQATPAPSP